jgi:uncharacterized protein YukE
VYPGQPRPSGGPPFSQPAWPAPGQDPEQPPVAVRTTAAAVPVAGSLPTTASPVGQRQPSPAEQDPTSGSAGGPDGTALTGKVDGHLDYVSQLAKHLGVNDPVESYLTPVVGAWSQMHDEATRWRTAAKAATTVSQQLTAPLGGLDAAWQGQDANSFLDYMQKVGLAGTDLSDAMTAMADALDKTADGIRQIVTQMVDMLTDTAEQSSDAMSVPVAGESRARQHLDDADEPTSKLYESVRDVLESFVKLCDGVHGGDMFTQITVAHPVPAQNWAPAAPAATPKPTPTPTSTTKPAATTAAATHTTAATPAAAHAAAAPAATAAAHQGGSAGGSDAAAAALRGLGGGGSGGGGDAGAGAPAASAGDSSGGAGGLAEQQSGPPPESGAVAEPAGGTTGQSLPADGGAAGAAGADGSTGTTQGGMPMSGMGGMRGGGQGGNQEHKTKIRVSGDLREIFGKPEKSAPPVIGGE